METEVTPPATEIPPTTEDLLTYEYQPKDEHGRALGGKQVVKGKTQQELLDNMAKQNTELIKLNRTLKWEKTRSAAITDADIPAGAERIDDDIDSKPIPLTTAERAQLARDITDPEKIDATLDRLLKARSNPREERIRKDTFALRAAKEGEAFQKRHPEFDDSKENCDMLLGWCMQRGLTLTCANYELAYRWLKEAGLLLEAPIAAEEEIEIPPNSQVEAEPEGRITQPETQPTKRPVSTSSGLTRRNSSSVASVPARRGLTWAEVDKLSDAEYKAKMRDPNFVKQVNALPAR